MAFIITDNDNDNLFDINYSRKSRNLEKYFIRYSKQEGDKLNIFPLTSIQVIFIWLRNY